MNINGLRKVSWASSVMALPWLVLEAFKSDVPDNFWAAETDEESFPIGVVSCPCGEAPRIYPGECEECGCGRFYLYTSKYMKVFRPDDVEAGVPQTTQ